MRKQIIIWMMMTILMIIGITLASECQPTMQPGDAVNCTITSLWNYGNCVNFHLVVYNISGNLTSNFTYYNSTPYCQTLWNITTIGSYTGFVENGDTVSIEIQGDKQVMSFGVIIFMVVFNLAIFLFPFFVTMSKHKATNYILKHLIFAGAILFFWLNITILRTMAINAGLGIDDLLMGVWWFATLGVVIILFTMVFTTTKGAMEMLKESEMRKRMGEDE